MTQDKRLSSVRGRAWRNTMVAAINACLEQRLFGLQGGQNHWPEAQHAVPPRHHIFEFSIDGIPGLGYVCAIGWDELCVHAALWPAAAARRWIVCENMTDHWGHLSGEVAACGWLERLEGCYLMPSPSLFYCRAARKPIVAELPIAPQGYKDRGRFIC